MSKARRDGKGRTLRKGESRRKSDGLYIYAYMDPTGKRKYVYASDLMKLREKEEEIRRDQLDGIGTYVEGRATVNYVFDRFIKTKRELRESTRSNYLYTYDHYVRKGFGKKLIASVKYSEVLYFYQTLMEEKGLSISTIESIQTVLFPTFELAVRDDIIRKNPCVKVVGDLKRNLNVKPSKRKALRKDQQKAFMDFLGKPEQLIWRPVFAVLLGTGCRVGEVVCLQWDDVDLEKRVVYINHTLSYISKRSGENRCEYVVSPPKTHMGKRSIPMLESVYQAFLEEKANQEMLGRHCKQTVDGLNDFVFCNRFNNVVNPSSLNDALRRIVSDYNYKEEVTAKKEHREAVLLPGFSCHNLRHTFCTRLCENGTNIKAIQAIMGHANIETTMNIYADVTEDMKEKAISDLSDEFDMF